MTTERTVWPSTEESRAVLQDAAMLDHVADLDAEVPSAVAREALIDLLDRGVCEERAVVVLAQLWAKTPSRDARPGPVMTPLAFRRRIERRADVLRMIERGLAGEPFSWGQGAAMNYRPIARSLGVELITETQAKKRGHEIKARAKPVGSIYFGAPIQRHADVYIYGVHTRPKASKEGK